MTIMELFAGALSYPDERIPQLRAELLGRTEEELPGAVEPLRRYLEATAGMSRATLCELYTRTFDLMAVCSPYAGIHLYGEDNYKRGGLMARLKEAFAAQKFDAGNELPDHLAVLLRYCAIAPAEESDEVREYLLRGPVESMVAILSKTQNPYAHLVTALQSALSVPEKSIVQDHVIAEGA
ncbi:MAG: molecular chaperone TorD family protein [Bacteroidetes bacterium]|nr:molecular chaperone TorD family protein [Bacteroidota bacterium]